MMIRVIHSVLNDGHQSGVFQFAQSLHSHALKQIQSKVIEKGSDTTTNQQTEVQHKENAVSIVRLEPAIIVVHSGIR